ncbi:hypothetical protein OH784_18200 [Ectobacillus funiculus]|uniref:hypothetical protein n=1 Tax=Ectobacillus funiculus TaxID=137993 RepID=UPI00397D9A48
MKVPRDRKKRKADLVVPIRIDKVAYCCFMRLSLLNKKHLITNTKLINFGKVVLLLNQETKVANELQKMMTWNLVPVSAQEDINEICDSLMNGSVTLTELENRDPFVVEIIHNAMHRVGQEH